jgi:nucleoid-associated protein YgaU
MTSDAKVGLLLGLVFIFIIAFVLNGLPRFRNAANNSELTTNMVNLQNDTIGIGTRERKAQEFVDFQEQLGEQTLEEIQAPAEETENVRYVMELPKNMYPPEETSNEETPDSGESVSFNPFEPVVSASVVDHQPEAAELEPVKPEPVRPAAKKMYVVGEGDSLSDIAKKFYGEQEGNRLVNITRIFEANKNVLKSPDDIFVGQKLVIPSLVISSTDSDISGDSLSESLFERVKSIGRRHLTQKSPDTIKPIEGEYYIVKDGDSLWRIAANKLGNGNRYTEISKLNTDVLEDDDEVFVGMRLRLPAR